MKALQVRAPGGLSRVSLVDLPMPGESPDVTVAMRAVGLCRTDLLVAKGQLAVPADLVLGHEGAGVVIRDPSGRFLPGQTVAINPYYPNGQFLGLHLPGILQEEVQIPANQLVLAEELPFHTAAYVEPVAASMAVLKALPGRERQRGLILGDNRIAHLTHLILQSLAYEVDWVKTSLYDGEPDQYDYAIETLFESQAVRSLMTALKPEGLLVVKSRQFVPTEVLPSLMVAKELTLKAVNYGDFHVAIDWLKRHQAHVEPLLGARYPLHAWEKAFEAASAPRAPKIFIEI